MDSQKIVSFTGLDVWKNSHALVLAVLRSCEKLSRNDALRNQLERAAISITSNIAEGFGRQSIQDKKHFYIMARGSAYELQNQLLIARDIGRISEDEFRQLSLLSVNSLRLLHGLIRSTGKSK